MGPEREEEKQVDTSQEGIFLSPDERGRQAGGGRGAEARRRRRRRRRPVSIPVGPIVFTRLIKSQARTSNGAHGPKGRRKKRL